MTLSLPEVIFCALALFSVGYGVHWLRTKDTEARKLNAPSTGHRVIDR